MDIDEIQSIDDIEVDLVKQYMRIDHDLDDLELALYLKSAISYVKKYVLEQYADDIELVMPVLMLVSHFYENKTPMNVSNAKYDSVFKDILWMSRGLVL
ncbi:head-tail connector protein [Terrisporobacter sp.]|uniref:head-tail connector protein n=1 Tax=Terrisporobacter sp. TaxID=1965305 RepID=UPI00399182C7